MLEKYQYLNVDYTKYIERILLQHMQIVKFKKEKRKIKRNKNQL